MLVKDTVTAWVRMQEMRCYNGEEMSPKIAKAFAVACRAIDEDKGYLKARAAIEAIHAK